MTHVTMADQIRAYRRHGTVLVAARELGIAASTFRHRLRAAGIDTAGRHRPITQLPRRRIAELCDLYDRGLTQRDLAAIAGVTSRAIKLMLDREGVPHRPPHNPSRQQIARRRATLIEIGREDLLTGHDSTRPLATMPPAEVARLVELYDQGLTFADLAALYGTSRKPIGMLLRREGVAIRQAGGSTSAQHRRRRDALEQLGRLDLLANTRHRHAEATAP